FKKLAGGGYFKIVNQSVPKALARLGYGEAEIADVIAYVNGTNTFTGAPYVSRRSLLDKGLTEGEIAKAERALHGVFDVSHALAPWVLGAEAYERLGIGKEDLAKPGFSVLKHWGLTDAQIGELNDHVIGRMTVEGAPHLKDEHLPVFDCANRCGKTGQRFLKPMSHVLMMAAAQPFLSGAISKTVNLPREATEEDVQDIYYQGWKHGLKAVALYRDGSKASQPLSTDSQEGEDDEAEAKQDKVAAKPTAAPALSAAEQKRAAVQIEEGTRPPLSVRHKLPKRRGGFTQEARVGGHKVFLRTGEYGDGSIGEIFIDMHKEGAAFRSLMNCFAISVSMGMQHGVPLESYVNQFTFTRFEPGGIVEGHPNVKFATSIIDYVFRVLGVEYLNRYDFAQVPPAEEQQELLTSTDATAAKRAEENTEPVPADEIVPAEQVTFGWEPPDEGPVAAAPARPEPASSTGTVLDQQLGDMMGDAPMCDQCGHITVRNGACYKCLNCGNSMGCS
ncbi:MAG: vitamin B12-dependent ribonucleotide reductase, partial [Myxococcota bacterium]